MAKRLTYFKTYPVGVFWEKIGLEIEVGDNEDTKKHFYAMKKEVETFHYESNKAAEKQAEAPVRVNKQTQRDIYVGEINKCTTPEQLRAWEFLSKNNPDLKEIYDNKLKELSA